MLSVVHRLVGMLFAAVDVEHVCPMLTHKNALLPSCVADEHLGVQEVLMYPDMLCLGCRLHSAD